jgi:hypothetical protein
MNTKLYLTPIYFEVNLDHGCKRFNTAFYNGQHVLPHSGIISKYNNNNDENNKFFVISSSMVTIEMRKRIVENFLQKQIQKLILGLPFLPNSELRTSRVSHCYRSFFVVHRTESRPSAYPDTRTMHRYNNATDVPKHSNEHSTSEHANQLCLICVA